MCLILLTQGSVCHYPHFIAGETVVGQVKSLAKLLCCLDYLKACHLSSLGKGGGFNQRGPEKQSKVSGRTVYQSVIRLPITDTPTQTGINPWGKDWLT